jgi:hypothetical protein
MTDHPSPSGTALSVPLLQARVGEVVESANLCVSLQVRLAAGTALALSLT